MPRAWLGLFRDVVKIHCWGPPSDPLPEPFEGDLLEAPKGGLPNTKYKKSIAAQVNIYIIIEECFHFLSAQFFNLEVLPTFPTLILANLDLKCHLFFCKPFAECVQLSAHETILSLLARRAVNSSISNNSPVF